MRNFRYLLLAFFLLGGQYALLLHAAGHVDAAHPDHACEVCLHTAALDNGIAPSVLPFASPILEEAPLPEHRGGRFLVVARLFDARGPPASLSA